MFFNAEEELNEIMGISIDILKNKDRKIDKINSF